MGLGNGVQVLLPTAQQPSLHFFLALFISWVLIKIPALLHQLCFLVWKMLRSRPKMLSYSTLPGVPTTSTWDPEGSIKLLPGHQVVRGVLPALGHQVVQALPENTHKGHEKHRGAGVGAKGPVCNGNVGAAPTVGWKCSHPNRQEFEADLGIE